MGTEPAEKQHLTDFAGAFIHKATTQGERRELWGIERTVEDTDEIERQVFEGNQTVRDADGILHYLRLVIYYEGEAYVLDIPKDRYDSNALGSLEGERITDNGLRETLERLASQTPVVPSNHGSGFSNMTHCDYVPPENI